jgi:hypothetical protein
MNLRTAAAGLIALLATASAVVAQDAPAPPRQDPPPAAQSSTTPPPASPDATQTAQTTPPPPPPVIPAVAGGDRRDSLPYVNLYLPEGQASIRLRKLIKNVLFESQIDYKFVSGDISTFLRYKYYARNFTYKIGVFDEIGFPAIEKGSLDFQRVRGGLLLFELPRDYDNRYFLLLQDDRLTFGNTGNADNRRNNIYGKLGYQYGTPFDERMNAIVGESRGRVTPVLTAFREIGPQKTGLAAAITQSTSFATGSYKYTKLEGEALRRFDLTSTSFVVSRLHFGTMLGKQHCTLVTDITAPHSGCVRTADSDLTEQFSVPLYEYFKLGGRDALKGVKDNASRGSDEVHITGEYFVPLFRNRDFKTFVMHWNTLYGIAYAGAGGVAFHTSDMLRGNNLVADAGLGAEAALTIRDFDVLLSVLYARTVHAPDNLGGSQVRFSIRTIR